MIERERESVLAIQKIHTEKKVVVLQLKGTVFRICPTGFNLCSVG